MIHENTKLAQDGARIAHELQKMEPAHDGAVPRFYRRITIAIALAILLPSALGAFAPRQGERWQLLHGVLSLDTVTATGFCLLAIALLLGCMRHLRLARWSARLIGALVAVAGFVSLAQGLLGESWVLHPWLAQRLTLAQFPAPRVHLLCSIGLALSALAVVLLDHRTRAGTHLSEYLACVVAAISAVLLIGYLFGVETMTTLLYPSSIGFLPALLFFVLAAGLLLARPTHRAMSILTRNAPGGKMLRRSLPQTLALLLALDWIAHWGAQQGWYDDATVVPALALMNSMIVLVVFWHSAGKVDREYETRLQNAAELSDATALLIAVSDNTSDPIFVKNRRGELIFANPATLRILGKTREEAMRRTSRELFIVPEDADQIDRDDMAVMDGGVSMTLERTLRLPHGVRTYAATKTPWFDKENRVIGVIGISTDITRRKRTEDLLKRHEAQLEAIVAERTELLRDLTDHLETVREEEKRAIARELHDDMGASLTTLGIYLDRVYRVFPDDAHWQEQKSRIQGLMKSLVATTRRIQTELRPTMLDLFGIKVAITEHLEEFHKLTGIACNASVPDEELTLSPKLQIVLYRMLQETLNNVSKHAQATRVDVILDVDEDHIAMTVRDNGVGIAPERIVNITTHGLRGLNERAAYLGGSTVVTAEPAGGTTVRISIPANALTQAHA